MADVDCPHPLRNGVTTGTCAAAAAACALRLMLTREKAVGIAIRTPAGAVVRPEILFVSRTPDGAAVCGIRKDAGDDPDITDGTEIRAEVSRRQGRRSGIPDRGMYTDPDFPGFFLTGGAGVGTVTLPGLPDPVGFPAINPVPRRMIFSACADELRRAGRNPGEDGGFLIVISVPEGERLAVRTFNPRLGVTGGISILGTSGIVRPMSEDALIASIRLDIRTKTARGMKALAAAPGNIGAAELMRSMQIPENRIVTISNYVGDSFRMMAEEGAERVLLAGHPGKLIKITGGVMNTHSKYGDRRMELMAQCALASGAGQEVLERISGCNTTDEACAVLRGEGLLERVMSAAAEQVRTVLEARFPLRVEVILCSAAAGLLVMTAGAEAFAREIRGEDGS
jgi:cobalt-precorrin-5B (C1)-methyltransferase